MSKENAAKGGQRALAHRTGASRKLLARKARVRMAARSTAMCVESDFPTAEEPTLRVSVERPSASRATRCALAAQMLGVTDFQPNPNTVIATIVSIVANRGRMNRAELIDTMRRSSFPHAAARPQDKGWCQGYVAGAIRNGFLTMVVEPSTPTAGEYSDALGEEV